MSLLPLGKFLSNLCQRSLFKFNLVKEQIIITVKHRGRETEVELEEEGEREEKGEREKGREEKEGKRREET